MSYAPADTDRARQAWNALTSYLEQWFYKPDLEALRIVLAAAAGHYFNQLDPIWLFVIGPSGSGKTAIYISACASLPKSHVQGDVTPKSLLSGSKGYQGWLKEVMGESGIILFKDFTTVLSKRSEDRMEIAAQLREVYDGKLVRSTGTREIQWKGRATVIAATTPAIDQHWGMMRDLGERFINVRLQRGDGMEAAAKAQAQIGTESTVVERLKELVLQFIQPTGLQPPAMPDESILLACRRLAEIAAIMRADVPRGNHGQGHIIANPTIEVPTRLAKVMTYCIASHAAMFRRAASWEDLALARRLAIDSMPPPRAQLFNHIPDDGSIGSNTLLSLSKMPRGSLDYHVENLQALGVLGDVSNNGVENSYSFSPEFRQLRRLALQLPGNPQQADDQTVQQPRIQ